MPSTKASTKPTHRMAISDVWCGIDRPVGGGGDDSEGLARSMQRAWRLVECAPHDLLQEFRPAARRAPAAVRRRPRLARRLARGRGRPQRNRQVEPVRRPARRGRGRPRRHRRAQSRAHRQHRARSEEHTSELQSLMRISYAVFCLKKKNKSLLNITLTNITQTNL